jgi:branched-chain amino acid transport system substrate-binding protein
VTGRVKLAVLLLAAFLPVQATLARSVASPGVMPSSVRIGSIAPLSGEGSGIARGAAAYFRYVNGRGGVNGRTIEYRVVDGRDPTRSLEAARRLVQQDEVFALFGTVGTEASGAIRRYVDESGVPELFVESAATAAGRWTIGFPPSAALEGAVLARQVLKTRRTARIAVLYEDGVDGRALLKAFRRGLGARAGSVPAFTEPAELRATRADTLVLLASAGVAARALAETRTLGRRPQVYVTAGASARVAAPGAVSVAYLKDPRDPRWAGDPAFERYRRTGGLRNVEYLAGMAAAFTLVDALRRSGKNLTRAGVMAAARSLNEANNPFVLPGIVVRTSAADTFPVQQVALQRWSGGRWNVFTGPLTIGR